MDEASKLQYMFQTLGDANRLRIIKFIGTEERPVSEIVEATGLSQPLVSHHLKALRNASLVETQRSGPFVYYKLKDKRIIEGLGVFLEIVESLQNIKIDKPMFYCPPWWKARWRR
jgi:DNA-binding transcriptional ArsR family regulator